MRKIVTALTALLVLTSLAAAPGAAQSEAYSGTHVSFGTSANAVTDYTVNGESMLSSVQVQSTSEAESSGIVEAGTSLTAVTSLEGSGPSVSAESSTSATIETEGSASMDAHDNKNGILVVRAGGESQYVQANVSDGAEASATGDGHVTVTSSNGVDGTFIVVGDGEATINEEGNVAAELHEDDLLVFRTYSDGKSDDDAAEEQLIADGEAAGEVHVMSDGSETLTDTVTYGSETAIETEQTAENEVEITVDRAASEGQVVITSVSESAIESTDDLSVAVDGEAAAEASSYSELRGAFGSEESRYLVQQTSSAEASADVLVAVNHFSERTITMSEPDGSSSSNGDSTSEGNDGDGDDDDATSSPGQPGFGLVVALLSVIAAALIAIRRG